MVDEDVKANATTAQLSPMMRQYFDVKQAHPDCLLFFRVGDFYELFDTDAQVAARELDITLTSRPEASYPSGRMPMAGVPYRAYESYLARLIAKGYSVAICDQVGMVGANKGPVERQVTRIFTPGTVLETNLLPARQNNYLMAILRGGKPGAVNAAANGGNGSVSTGGSGASGASTGNNGGAGNGVIGGTADFSPAPFDGQNTNSSGNGSTSATTSSGLWGLAYVDAACGEFCVSQLNEQELLLEIARLNPSEILVPTYTAKAHGPYGLPQELLDVPQGLNDQYRLVGRPNMFFALEPSKRRIMQTFSVSTLEGFGCHNMPLAIGSAGAIIEYLERTQAKEMPRFHGISTYSTAGHLVLDANTRRNLELVETVRDRNFEGSLLSVIDQTLTAMGSRQLRKWLLQPLYSVAEIEDRQKAISELLQDSQLRQELSQALKKITDLERLGVKLASGTVNPKEMEAVLHSLYLLPELSAQVQNAQSKFLVSLAYIEPSILELIGHIERAIGDDPPREITNGGIFRQGFCAELDEIRGLLHGGKNWIEEFQKKEQERSGIRSLKVNFNSNFGYYIEITHANKDAIPTDYVRKQTLTNAERYITPELKEYEAKILNAEKNQGDLEYKLYLELRKKLTVFGSHVLKIAQALASVDALLSLSLVALERKYVCPVVDDSLVLEIKNGRHPVLEKILPMGKYVANDTHLYGDSKENQLIILTGPNMSGKSSLLRQAAHIVLLAQMGSFVPADYARIGLVDRIFTRIGAVDDLTQGQSTFLVEMAETTECCLSASKRSLILLDEVGRGTSTYDGVAIAWSVAEFLANSVCARTVFATHYHELNGLANFFPQIANFQVLVKELDGHVEFMRKVVAGGASRSFGVQVAKMAGLPATIIDRAQFLMGQMEKKSAASKILDGPKVRELSVSEVMQLSLSLPNGE
jgi:DNA mismatch repair protein MutS